MGYGDMLLLTAIVIAGVMLATWLVSLALRDASVVDPVWPLGFIAVALTALVAGGGDEGRRVLIAVLVGVWGLRLSFYLAKRNFGKPEDFRYAAMRKKHGARFWIVSLFTVFVLQGVLMWIVSLPVQLASVPDRALGWLAIVGAVVWAIGLGFEATAASISRRCCPVCKALLCEASLGHRIPHHQPRPPRRCPNPLGAMAGRADDGAAS
jgi:steroid 5-alpha reductase family enzyme